MRLRLSKSKIDVSDERFIICEMMIRWKECDEPPRIHLPKARQAIGDGRCSSVIMRLDEQARRSDSGHLIGIIALVRPRHDQKCLGPGYHPAYPLPSLL